MKFTQFNVLMAVPGDPLTLHGADRYTLPRDPA